MAENKKLGTYSLYSTKDRPQPVKEETPKAEKITVDLKGKYESHPLQGEELVRRAFQTAWYDGHQHLKVSYTRDKLVAKKRKSGQLRYRSKGNILKRNGRDATAMLIKDNPRGQCVPMDNTFTSKNAARVGNQILENAYDRPDLAIDLNFFTAEENAYKHGTGWLKCIWNPNLFYYNPKSNKWNQIGDIELSAHDDFEIFPDPNAKNWFQVKWILHVYLQDIDEIENLYPEWKGKIQAWEGDDDQVNRNLYRPSSYYMKTPPRQRQGLVAEFYSRPSKSLLNIEEKEEDAKGLEAQKKTHGAHYVCVNWQYLVKNEINPYHELGYFLCLPFIPVWWFASSDKLHGQSPLREQIPRQYEYNKFNSIIAESAFFHGIPRIVVQKGSGFKDRQIDDNPRMIWETLDGNANVVRPAPIPNYVVAQRDHVAQEAQRDANVGAMAFGELPTGFSGSSGAALRQIQGRQMGRYAPEVELLKISTKILNLLILGHYKAFALEKRFINLMGKGKKYQIASFKGSDLQGSWDIKMPVTSAYRNSPAAKSEAAMNLWDRGILQEALMGNPAAIKLLDIIEFGTIEEAAKKEKMHREKAEYVIHLIMSGKGVPDVEMFDMHQIHLEALQEVMANPDFIDERDDIKEAIRGRAFLHLKYIMQQMRMMQPQPGQEQGPPQDTEGSIENMTTGAEMTPRPVQTGPPTEQ